MKKVSVTSEVTKLSNLNIRERERKMGVIERGKLRHERKDGRLGKRNTAKGMKSRDGMWKECNK